MRSDIAFSPEIANKAFSLILPTIQGMMKNNVVKRGHLYLASAWIPPANPHTDVVPVMEHSIGEVSSWASDYKLVALGKLRIAARTKMSSREVAEDYPELLLEGEPRWPGAVIIGDVGATASGVEAEFDELCAYMYAHAINALRYNAPRETAA